jgi:hypothetical protein
MHRPANNNSVEKISSFSAVMASSKGTGFSSIPPSNSRFHAIHIPKNAPSLKQYHPGTVQITSRQILLKRPVQKQVLVALCATFAKCHPVQTVRKLGEKRIRLSKSVEALSTCVSIHQSFCGVHRRVKISLPSQLN